MQVKFEKGGAFGALKGVLISIVSQEDVQRSKKCGLKGFFESVSGSPQKEIENVFLRDAKRENFLGKHLSALFLRNGSDVGPQAIFFVGFELPKNGGSEGKFKYFHSLRKLGQTINEMAKKHRFDTVSIVGKILSTLNEDESFAIVEGAELSNYSFTKYRSKNGDEFYGIKNYSFYSRRTPQKGDLKAKQFALEATLRARDLVNMPARECTPSYMVKVAKKISSESGLNIKVFNNTALTKMGADLMLSVFRSSNEEPFLIRMHYKPLGKSKKKIIFVGKGVTFDSGGLSIKSGNGMFDMKCDMAGGAAVMYAMGAIGRIKPQVEVIAYVPTTENMIRDTSTRPGDVATSLNGKTVEILNTDAEGRLILADALVLADREKGDLIIDLATLTGSIVGAIGSDYAGIYSNDDKIAGALIDTAATCSERLWRMPLAPEYRDRLKSPVADIKNIGGAEAGNILAGLFLQEFVKDTPWVHIDLAGPAFLDADRGYQKKGGTGFALRSLVEYVCSL